MAQTVHVAQPMGASYGAILRRRYGDRVPVKHAASIARAHGVPSLEVLGVRVLGPGLADDGRGNVRPVPYVTTAALVKALGY